jgi:hypothetical protein
MAEDGGDKMKDEKFILYVQTSDEPERQYSPLVLAQTAKAMGLIPKLRARLSIRIVGESALARTRLKYAPWKIL